MLNFDVEKNLARGHVFEQTPWSILHLESFGDNNSKDAATWNPPQFPAWGAGSGPLTWLPRQNLTTVIQIPANGAACLGLEVQAALAALVALAALAALAGVAAAPGERGIL